MSRKSEFQTTSPNPAKKFLSWKSNDKNFSYYDKEKGQNVAVELPFKFLTLMEFHTVKGWNDASESAIYSNEVKAIGSETLEVKSFKGGLIAKGLYKDIKTQVNNAGGYYSKSIYGMLEDGSIVNVNIKGSSVKEWGDFTKKSRRRLSEEWVCVTEAKEMKKGSITYSVPVFFYNRTLNDAQAKLADKDYDELKEYMAKYVKADNTPLVEVAEVAEVAEVSNARLADLDF